MNILQKAAIICGLFISTGSFAQTGVKVTYYDGNSQTFNVYSSGKLYFSNDNLLLQSTETSGVTTIPVSIIRKVNFTDPLVVLAVDLVSFNISAAACAATVNWQSAAEENFSYYELEYGSTTAFDHSQKISAKGSNSQYSVSLAGLKGRIYYRLKMVDLDGSEKYSDIISNEISCGNTEDAVIYPNPGADIIRIRSSVNKNWTIKIFSTGGQLVKQGNFQTGQDIDIASLAAGVYIVQINGYTTKLIKQ